MSAPGPLVPAGPADLEALLPLLESFSASQGIPFDATQARAALGALLLSQGFSGGDRQLLRRRLR